ncbi:MAG: transcription-repair coupling factor [Candidatus Melainabacteria bacterium RIFCSPLOWO2_12_FULL_35_11]|nr:MAG: transcription-repair coupling factor [Candidatus Melainabacteria bacterium RIFCSPLOWO2_12_FULL_35_11]
MVIEKLIHEFQISAIGQTVIPRLKAQKAQELHFHGLTDPAKGFFLTSLIYSLNRPILYLASDLNFALNLYLEVSNLTGAPVFYFPIQEVSPYDQISSDTEIITNQTKALLHLLNKKEPCLIIGSAKSLLEKIWNPDDLKNNTFEVNFNTNTEPALLAKKLVSLGYKKSNLVTSRGEFSIRGDIFDVYPIVGEPARIEYFGEEIESIRIYSPATQRSQENISNIIITPRYYIAGYDAQALTDKITQLLNYQHDLKEITNQEVEQIKLNTYSESIEYYAQLTNQKQSSLFDYLPENTLVIIDDWETNAINLKSSYQRNLDIKKELEKNKKIIPLPELLINEAEFILKKIKNYSISYIERFELFDKSTRQSIDLSFLPVDRFQNQIEKFAEKIREWFSLNQKIIIYSDQPQRITGILREWNIPGKYLEFLNEEDYKQEQVFISKGGTINGFKMGFANIIILTDREIFGTKRRPNFLKKNLKSEKYDYYSNIEDLKTNDYVVHIKHGIGRYRGLVKVTLDNVEREYLMIEYASDGKLYLPVEQINILYRYRGSTDVVPKLSKLGGADWESTKKKVKKAVKRVAEDLLNLYTARSKLEGFSFNPDSHWQIEMEEAFPYTETPDQWKAICDVKADMESTKPMDRLICGDVGYGKTEVAIRAIFKAVLSGKQVAVLVPTTILAEQHFNVISERLTPFPVRTALLSRFISPGDQKKVVSKLALGEFDVVIGTHRLLQNDVTFKDLGLVVIDEEQRFGVIHKERLKQLRVTVDVITLSATPIPRTLHMALTGARDMSLINTAPLNRLPIKTFVGEFKPTIIKTSILHELERSGQVYFVHNRIESINQTAAYLKELVPEAQIIIAHGQMQSKELENVMLDFSLKKFNILVCTTIIESGLDIPNVNTIIINNADHMGLAQLYQLRGRVGRSDVQAYAYCLYPNEAILTETAKNRLAAIKEFSTLGSGYQIAIRDMEIRGVGNILGAEQHGHMISVGFDLYCQLLNEAVDKLRGLEVRDKELECIVDLNISAYIPNSYIEDDSQKVIEYKRLANVRTNKELEYIASEWKDRFGNFPDEVKNLIRIVDLRTFANELDIKYIKSESGAVDNVKIFINLRLQSWLSMQGQLPKSLIGRVAFKGSARGGSENSYLLVKTSGLSAEQQLEVLFELIRYLKATNMNEKIA